MHRPGSLRVSFVLAVSAVSFASCGEIVRGSVKILGAEGITDRQTTGGPIGGTPKPSIVALVKGSHRTVEGHGPIVVAVVRQNPGDGAVSIEFRSREWAGLSPATPGSDYVPTWGTLRWGSNDGSPRLVSIQVLSDRDYEGTEILGLDFSNVQGARSTVDSVTCYIDDASTPPQLTSDVSVLSAARGGAQQLRLRAGIEHAGRAYFVAGSFGTSPGFSLGRRQIPLNIDPWFEITVHHANGQNFRRTSGILNFNGEGFAEIRSAPITVPNVVGVQLHHAYLVYDVAGVFHMVSNPVSLTIVR